MKSYEPLFLRPAGKNYLWGGMRLKTEYGKDLPMTPLAETWECSTHPDGPSVVVGGTYDGMTLREVLRQQPEFLGKCASESGELPILVKLIDAAKDLSVQVHPNDAYALAHEGQPGKTELWYVVDARPGTRLVCGFEHDVTAGQLREAIVDGTLQKHLHSVEIHPGDTFFVPPGTVHAIGAGALIAEIQQSSNVTYRLYDYSRRDKDGNLRQLHVEKALDVLNMKCGFQDRQIPRLVRYRPGCAYEIIGRCKYFQVERLHIVGQYTLAASHTGFQVLLVIRGTGELSWQEKKVPMCGGVCVFLPVNMEHVNLTGNLEVLQICL